MQELGCLSASCIKVCSAKALLFKSVYSTLTHVHSMEKHMKERQRDTFSNTGKTCKRKASNLGSDEYNPSE